MAKKKTNGLSIAIIALNILIVGVIILLVVLVYLHMKEDTDNGRGSSTSTTTTEATPENTEDSSQTTDQSVTLPSTTYNKEFFANDLFIGDSISTGLYGYEFLDKRNVFAEVGLNPESAATAKSDDMTCVEKTAAMQPRNIYIMLGTNGLAFLEDTYMATKMVELIAQLENACPTASIYVITIPPVTAAHDAEGKETMTKINSYNDLLRNICSQGGYGCIDLCPLLQDESGYLSSAYAEEDGLHFLQFAYQVMLSFVEKSAG